jgi:two-component system sensor histidine kinase HydH
MEREVLATDGTGGGSMNDIRTTTTLVCAILAGVIAFSTVPPKRVRRVHWAFFFFAVDLACWYACQAILHLSELDPGAPRAQVFFRAAASFAVAVPFLALRLFDAVVPLERTRGSRLRRTSLALATSMAIIVIFAGLIGLHSLWVRVPLFLYVFVILALVLFSLRTRGKRSSSRMIRGRVEVLVIIGALAYAATMFDFGSIALQPDTQAPPVGAVLSIVALYALREALRSELLFDTLALFAQLLAATLLGAVMALIFYGLSHYLSKHFDPTFLAAVLGITVCVLFDFLRARIEEVTKWVQGTIVRTPPLESSTLHRRLLHILTLEDMKVIVMDTLGASRRVTCASLYLRDPDGTGFDRIAGLGPSAAARVDIATTAALVDRLARGPLVLEEVEARSRREGGARPRDAAVLEAAARLGVPTSSVFTGIRGDAPELMGLLVVVPDGAFSSDEIRALESITGHIRVVIESSEVYAEMKARDRLAVIGQMTAGLAHEIRNPLGSIKGAAQLLVRLGAGAPVEADSRKYLGIIVEEVDRLARVLDSVLDLAPRQPTVSPIDVNAVARRTLQVFSAEPDHEHVEVHEALEPDLPRVAIDPEQLRQVLLNLLRNAAQATQGRGKVSVSTTARAARNSFMGTPAAHPLVVELKVTDNGPGLPRKVLEKLFMPFFTTKKDGTGLGLAISQRIVQEASGRIEARPHEGQGTTFAVVLPAAMDALGTPTPRSASATP